MNDCLTAIFITVSELLELAESTACVFSRLLNESKDIGLGLLRIGAMVCLACMLHPNALLYGKY